MKIIPFEGVSIKDFENIGVCKDGIKVMYPKTKTMVFKIKDIPVASAIVLKQECLSIGAECALPYDVLYSDKKFNKIDALLICPNNKINLLAQKLKFQPFKSLKQLAEYLIYFLSKIEKIGKRLSETPLFVSLENFKNKFIVISSDKIKRKKFDELYLDLKEKIDNFNDVDERKIVLQPYEELDEIDFEKVRNLIYLEVPLFFNLAKYNFNFVDEFFWAIILFNFGFNIFVVKNFGDFGNYFYLFDKLKNLLWR